MNSPLWCCRFLSTHAYPSCMHVRTHCDVCLHICSLYMHVHMSRYLTACEYDCMCYAVFETEEVKRKDGSGLTWTDRSVKMVSHLAGFTHTYTCTYEY